MYAHQKDQVKQVIANRDINDPAEFKEIAPVVEIDLEDFDESSDPQGPDFPSSVIALAAADEQDKLRAEKQRQKRRDAKAMAAELFKAAAEEVERTTGVSIGFNDPYAYMPKPTAAYGLWKRVVPLLVQDVKVLGTGPIALAKWLDGNEPSYTITRDMMYDKLNKYAVSDLKRLLHKMGVTLKLQPPVSIRSVQKELQARRDAKTVVDTETFSGRFEIRGDTAHVNGKRYKIQLNASGKRRIKRGGKEWLPLDTLKAFCTGE